MFEDEQSTALVDRVEETPAERKKRQRREANARWRAKPGNAEKQRAAQKRWLEDPSNRAKLAESVARYRATPEGRRKNSEASARSRAKRAALEAQQEV